MSALFGRYRQVLGYWALALTAAGPLWAMPAQADSVTINVDQAQIMQLPDKVATIIIGNPLIADATLQSGSILVVTGKGYGATNLLALDRAGHTVMNKTIQVLGASGDDVVVVYKGIERETLSCAPDCQHRITLGDSPNYFNTALTQSGARNGQAQAAPPR